MDRARGYMKESMKCQAAMLAALAIAHRQTAEVYDSARAAYKAAVEAADNQTNDANDAFEYYLAASANAVNCTETLVQLNHQEDEEASEFGVIRDLQTLEDEGEDESVHRLLSRLAELHLQRALELDDQSGKLTSDVDQVA